MIVDAMNSRLFESLMLKQVCNGMSCFPLSFSLFSWTGRVLRTDVIVDFIKSLQIVTKTHELYLEEAPEEFAVQAYDDQGNQFRWVICSHVWPLTIIRPSGGAIYPRLGWPRSFGVIAKPSQVLE